MRLACLWPAAGGQTRWVPVVLRDPAGRRPGLSAGRKRRVQDDGLPTAPRVVILGSAFSYCGRSVAAVVQPKHFGELASLPHTQRSW
eukprot:1199568-Pyramimonas_sp.AAC.1